MGERPQAVDGVPERAGGRRMFVSAAWVAVNHGGAALIAIGTLIAMARLLDPVEFAVAAVAYSIVSLFTPLAEGFFNDVLLQRRSLGPRDLASAWFASIALGGALSALVWLAAPALAAIVHLPDVAEVLPWMGLTLVVGSTASVPAAFARRRGRYRFIAVRTVPGRLAGALIGVAAAFLGFGAWSFVAQHLAATVISSALVFAGAGLRLRPARFSFRRLRGLVRFSLASLTDVLILPSYARIATPLMSAFLGPEPAAHWNIAFRLVDMLYMMIYSAAGHLLLPALARLQHDAAAVRRRFEECTALGGLVVFPVFAGMAVTAPELVRTLLGEAWAPAAPLMTVLSLATILLFLRQFVLLATTAVGQPGFATRISAQSLLAGLLGLLAGAPFGLLAAALGSCLRVLPFYAPGAALMRRATGLGFGGQVRPAARPLLASASMAVFVLVAARPALLAAGLPAPLVLLGCVALGVAAYLLAVAVLARGTLLRLLGGSVPGFGGRFAARPDAGR